MNDSQITMLGTGNAIVTKCYNTCFVIRSPQAVLLIDAGGGNGILSQLEKAHVDLRDIHNLFITHAHTDHILGVIWVTRMIINLMKGKKYEGSFTIHSHEKALNVLSTICRMTFSKKDLSLFDEFIQLHELRNNDTTQIGDMSLRCFDILSTKEKQFGFNLLLPDGQHIACLGDEPFNEANRAYVEHADWLLCEAFCLYRDREIFKPYEKHHSTAFEAGILANKLQVKHLILYHTEDQHLDIRKQAYTEEARQNFAGNIFVPDDLDIIKLS